MNSSGLLTQFPHSYSYSQLEGDQTLEKLAQLTGYDGPALQLPAPAEEEAP